MMKETSLMVLLMCSNTALVLSQQVAPITYLDQPKDVDLPLFISRWPGIQGCISLLDRHDTSGAESCLQRLIAEGTSVDGALNLSAQIERRKGNLDAAMDMVERAIELAPNEHLHYFQKALIAFRFREDSWFPITQWKWHNRTKEAYEQALALEPRGIFYRYYIAYSYMNTPGLFGGDKQKALHIANKGIRLGMNECHLIRADAYLVLGKLDSAFFDYDTSIMLRVFKKNLSSFKAGGYSALEHKDYGRAKRYFEYLVECRPDHPDSYDCLGDFYLSVNDTSNALKAFHAALDKDPGYSPSLEKLNHLSNKLIENRR